MAAIMMMQKKDFMRTPKTDIFFSEADLLSQK
jgi:hypothetical protein